MKKTEKLSYWQEKLEENLNAYRDELDLMDWREQLYAGSKVIKNPDGKPAQKKANHVRNIVSELIESEVNSEIPPVKVTALRKEDEGLAKTIEDMLRNEFDRLPFEYYNDEQERVCPIQGGDFMLVEWDDTIRTHTSVGEIKISEIHPKKFIPQAGVYNLEDMDYFFLRLPQTKQYIKRRYDVDLEDENEESDELRSSRRQDVARDMVTQNIVYYKNSDGGIGRYSWVNDTVLEDIDDYQARQIKRCVKCGEPMSSDECVYCGSRKSESRIEQYETLSADVMRSDGSVITAFEDVYPEPEELPPLDLGNMSVPGAGLPVADGRLPERQNTKIPYYKPDIFPVVLRKNVSVFGKLLGDSDVDRISDQQNAIKEISTNIHERMIKGGSIVTLPVGLDIEKTDEELKIVRVNSPAEVGQITVQNIRPDVRADLEYNSILYDEARSELGITDSFQGKRDPTATSGKAKEISAARSAGRLESKAVMKNAFYARLGEVIFKLKLAYADEPRNVVSKDTQGNSEYGTFNRYDFLKQDADGQYYWEDRFLFSTDASASLAGDRQAMWQETRMNFEGGAYGNPAELETLILFWSKMAALHYPTADDTKTYFEDKLKEQQAAAQQAAAQQAAAQQAAAGMQNTESIPAAIPDGTAEIPIGQMNGARTVM